VPVEAGSIYRLSCRARSEADAGSLRVHLVWYGEERKQVAASVSVLDTGPAYQTLIGTFTAPCGAVGAEIFLCGHESGWVLLDEVAFQRIKGRTGT